jgi:hypothetical protein
MMIVGSSIDSSRGPRPISQLASRLSRFSSLWRIRHSSAITVRIPPCWMRTYNRGRQSRGAETCFLPSGSPMLGRCPARTRPPAALRLAFGAKTFLIRSLRSRENFSPGT